jgi:UDP-N-acetylmuramoylalanine-D-glutamate ligase
MKHRKIKFELVINYLSEPHAKMRCAAHEGKDVEIISWSLKWCKKLKPTGRVIHEIFNAHNCYSNSEQYTAASVTTILHSLHWS